MIFSTHLGLNTMVPVTGVGPLPPEQPEGPPLLLPKLLPDSIPPMQNTTFFTRTEFSPNNSQQIILLSTIGLLTHHESQNWFLFFLLIYYVENPLTDITVYRNVKSVI
jgi:hypothetical protein